ncbi:hypothetical protein FA362_26525 [Pseudomonas aeruginosa]|uniref:hypothetical protein n=1 Tax=Pseudomonas aeruginosa TaxID=287 RepID=UPI000F53BC13|nr:hypothetical protein [Pseudomonas aeruginosa]MCO2348605.1 hypothetical protein [Pseudomonas aeruginosa]MCO2733868.1 hypothetical protein [Pseudomonas aeruginosa]RPV40386.1 hypothetical protein IPC797_12810 [Pseudomonas aeruginosa]RPV68672.1 hypothetical protein IPC796_14880 [Pseudomonas aeruginosa]HEJ1726191.1 hypothetical protein [Pseudomonas aeruginosa]
MSSTQHQLIEQCATRLRGIVEALDNIHDSTPHRWSTDLDDVHSSAESLLAMIKDQAPPPCIDCKGTGFCNSISGEEIRYPCHAPIQLADPAQTPVEQFEQAPPSEDQLTAAGLSYPLAKEDAVNLWYAGFRSEVVTVLEAWEAIGHDIGMNPSKGELLDSLRYMLEKCEAHDDALARVKALEALVAARIKDVPVDAPVIAVVGDFNEEQVHECKRFHDAIRAQRNPKAIVVFLNSKNDIQAVDEAAMCAAGWVRAEAPVAQAEQAEAERPEVVAFRYRCTNAEGEPLPGWFYSDDAGTLGLREPLTTVAECDRIVGALRAENERLANDRDRANRFANTAALDNDAALARVAELEQAMAEKDPFGTKLENIAKKLDSTLRVVAQAGQVPQAWLDVQAERRRQVEVEGYHGFRDSHYISYELSKAARAYIEVSWHALSGGLPCKKPESWPWMAGFKWSDGRTMLVKACALALAEIERLDRAAATQGGPSDA